MILFGHKMLGNLKNSLRGIKIALSEHSFISELLVGLLLLPLIIILERSTLQKAVILLLYFLVLIFELFNTSIERLCDRITTELDEDIRDIKDMSSASVFLGIIILLIGVLIFLMDFPKF